jgi:Zn-dependent protease
MEPGTRPTSSGFAPYAAPSEAPGADAERAERPEPVYYAIDSRRVTLREYWWGSRASVLSAAILKLIRIRIPSATDDPNVESLLPFELPAGDVPGIVVQRFAPMLQQLKTLGFHSPIWHVIEDDLYTVRTYLATLQGDTGRVWARVHHRVWSGVTPPRTKLYCELVSEVAGGTFLWSLSSKADLAAPPACTVLRDVRATPSRLLAKHLSELRLLGIDRVASADSTDALRASVERHHAMVRDFHLARGVFVPLTAEQRETSTAMHASVQSAKDDGSAYPQILAQIEQIQNRKSSRAAGVLLLLASVALFVGASMTDAGKKMFPPEMLGIMVGVLFIHEIGHWVAMRMFGYRNLKMFFIPFFGAAVSGRHYNVAGWKKVVVSLMGPLPGIVLGAALGAAGIRLHHELLIQVSVAALILNGLNLLPILPFDGGWVMQAILFSRHHLLELLFRITALLALAVISAVSDDRILLYVAIGMGASLPATYKLSRITSALRRERLPASSNDGRTVPQATADAIIGKLKVAFPKKLSDKAAAQFTLQIFENLNARPPGVLASLCFAILQFGAIAGAVVGTFVILVGGRSALAPKVDAASVAIVRTPGDSALAAPRNILVADFAKVDPAGAIGELRRTTGPEVGIARFGRTVLVSVPFEDVDGIRQAQTKVESAGAKAFVSTPEEPARMQITCTVPNAGAGAAIDEELGGYLNGKGLDLVPPWQPNLSWTVDERVRYAHARETYRSISKWRAAVYGKSEVLAFTLPLGKAYATRDTAQVLRIEAERDEVVARLRGERMAQLRAAAGTDTAVVDALALVESDPDTATIALRRSAALGPLLGQLPTVEGHAAPEAAQWSASGFMGLQATQVSAVVQFSNAFQGAPALTRWLLGKGCVEMQYGFRDAARSKQ